MGEWWQDILKLLPKSEVHYTSDHGRLSEQCSKCRHYVNPTSFRGVMGVCVIVAGRIDPDGWCDRFKRAK